MDVDETATTTLPADLHRRGPVGRFAGPIEERFQAWHRQQIIPMILIVSVCSVPAWFGFPFLADIWVDGGLGARQYVVALGINVPILVALTVYLTFTKPARWVIPFSSAVLLVVAIDTYLVIYWDFPGASPGAFALTIVWYNLIGAFARIPFRTSVVMSFTVAAVGGWFFIDGVISTDAPATTTWPYIAFVVPSLVMIPGMTLVGERSARDRFVSQILIERQRQQLAESQRLIRRYAPTAVASRIELGDTSVDAAQRRRVTVFSSDVVGFTSLADQLDPEALAEIINDYVASLAELIDRHGGTVTEFAGDGMMAIFGAPDEADPEDQVRATLAAATEFHASLPGWSQRWYRLGITRPLQARVGLNTGVVSVGTFGSSLRATYTGIGLQMNIAARIQSHADPGTTLLSSTSWHLVKDEVSCEPHGEVMVKGVHFPIEMYQPRDDPE